MVKNQNYDFLNKKRKTQPTKAKPLLTLPSGRKSAFDYIIKNYKHILSDFNGKYIERFLGDGQILTALFPKKAELITDNPLIREFYSSISYKIVVDINFINLWLYNDKDRSDAEREKVFYEFQKYLRGEIEINDFRLTKWYVLSRPAIFYAMCRICASTQRISFDSSFSPDFCNFGKNIRGIVNAIDDDYIIDYFNEADIVVRNSEEEESIVAGNDDFLFINVPKNYSLERTIELISDFWACSNGLLVMDDTLANRALWGKDCKIFAKNRLFSQDEIHTNSKNVIVAIRYKGEVVKL